MFLTTAMKTWLCKQWQFLCFHVFSQFIPCFVQFFIPVALLQQMQPGSATHPYMMPSPMGYTYYNPQTVGSYPAIVPTYDAGAAACTIPVSMGTSQMMASLSNTQTIANGLTQQLIMAPPSVAKQLEVGNLICTVSPLVISTEIPNCHIKRVQDLSSTYTLSDQHFLRCILKNPYSKIKF